MSHAPSPIAAAAVLVVGESGPRFEPDLRAHGIACASASTGADAAQHLRAAWFSFVVVPHVLPDMVGADFVQSLIRHVEGTAAILLGSEFDAETVKTFVASGRVVHFADASDGAGLARYIAAHAASQSQERPTPTMRFHASMLTDPRLVPESLAPVVALPHDLPTDLPLDRQMDAPAHGDDDTARTVMAAAIAERDLALQEAARSFDELKQLFVALDRRSVEQADRLAEQDIVLADQAAALAAKDASLAEKDDAITKMVVTLAEQTPAAPDQSGALAEKDAALAAATRRIADLEGLLDVQGRALAEHEQELTDTRRAIGEHLGAAARANAEETGALRAELEDVSRSENAAVAQVAQLRAQLQEASIAWDGAISELGAAKAELEVAALRLAAAEKSGGDLAAWQGQARAVGDELKAVMRQRDEAAAQRDETLAHRDNALAQRDGMVAQQNAVLAQRDEALAQRDAAIAQQSEVLAQRDAAIDVARQGQLAISEQVATRTRGVKSLIEALTPFAWGANRAVQFFQEKNIDGAAEHLRALALMVKATEKLSADVARTDVLADGIDVE